MNANAQQDKTGLVKSASHAPTENSLEKIQTLVNVLQELVGMALDAQKPTLARMESNGMCLLLLANVLSVQPGMEPSVSNQTTVEEDNF